MFRSLRQRFKLKDKDKLRVNLKYLTHYILAQIIYIDDQYDIYKAPKAKNKKYLVRIYQILDKRKYRNAKYIYIASSRDIGSRRLNAITRKIPNRRMLRRIIVVEMS